jgi:alkylhydroperoxidase family enzyme
MERRQIVTPERDDPPTSRLGVPVDSRGAWIETVSETEAEGELAALYRQFGGRVANILKSNSPNPPVLGAHYNLYRAIMFGPSPLTRAQREMIATTVSLLNQCHY